MPPTKSKICFGLLFQRGDGATPTEAFNTIGEVLDVSGGISLTRAFEDATNMESPDGYREYIPSLKDMGEITFQVNAVYSDAQQNNLVADLEAGTLRNFRVILPASIGKRWEGAAYVASVGHPKTVSGKLVRDVSLRPSGRWVLANNP